MNNTAILILAAGGSTRMGFPKQLLSLGTETLLQNSINKVQFITVNNVFVVLGANYTKISQNIHYLKCTQLKHNAWENGIGSSIAFGVKKISKNKNYKRVVILVADQPALKTVHIQNLITKHIKEHHKITITVCKNYKGVPVVFDAKYFKDLMNLTGDEGAKSIIKRYQGEVSNYCLDLEVLDIDTPKDYQKYLKN